MRTIGVRKTTMRLSHPSCTKERYFFFLMKKIGMEINVLGISLCIVQC